VNALLQARRSSDKRTFVADEFFESVNELCEKQDFGSFEEVRVAMRGKASDVHRALTDMLKNNLRPRTHEEQRERLRNLVKNREDCEIVLNDERYVIGRLMSETENSLRKFSTSVPPAAIVCLVDEMYREIRERYEFLDLSRDVVESWIFRRLNYMYVNAIENTAKDKTWREHRDRLRNRNPDPDTFGIDKKIQKRLFRKKWRRGTRTCCETRDENLESSQREALDTEYRNETYLGRIIKSV